VLTRFAFLTLLKRYLTLPLLTTLPATLALAAPAPLPTSLLDGSSLRLPTSTIRSTRDGQVMEMNPRPMDVPVTRPIGESYTPTMCSSIPR
jgi:hypothetical protein